MSEGKIILKGEIELLSPAIIGCGKDEKTDLDLIRDSEGRPFIPGTSFVGMLKNIIKLNLPNSYLEKFWGTKDNQSSLIIKDLVILDDSIETAIRDGVKINNKTGIAEEKAKFEYEIIERGARFQLYIEADLDRENFNKKMLATITKLLQEGVVRIGAKTNCGFGKIKLKEYKFYEFNFVNRQDVLRWIKRDFSESREFGVEPFQLKEKRFIIEAKFKIKNSLIVRSYNASPDKPDMEHIKSKNTPVLPGTSIKGAIRSRAEKILNTIGKPISIAHDLFGFVDPVTKKAKKGRISIDESILPDYPSEVQTRIKIDRFTGGVIEGALFETMPLFSDLDSKIFNITIIIEDYKDYEAGLMLLILKDLWTGDLPIGGEKSIGRGVLQGEEAKISWETNQTVEIKNIENLSDENKRKLENFVEALVNYGVNNGRT